MEKVNLAEKFARFTEAWSPKVVGALNGQQVKLARFRGAFVRHQHADEDELFLVVEGRLRIDFDDRAVTLEAGEFLIVPRGTPHLPVAEPEALVLLFEPDGTLNTGDTRNAFTVERPERL